MSIEEGQDIIDSREVEARILELQGQEGDDPLDEDEQEELKKLLALKDEAEECSDWEYGATLVCENYWVAYAEELAAEVIGTHNDQMNRWPFTCIDWQQAADELEQDYHRVKFGATEYLIRA